MVHVRAPTRMSNEDFETGEVLQGLDTGMAPLETNHSNDRASGDRLGIVFGALAMGDPRPFREETGGNDIRSSISPPARVAVLVWSRVVTGPPSRRALERGRRSSLGALAGAV